MPDPGPATRVARPMPDPSPAGRAVPGGTADLDRVPNGNDEGDADARTPLTGLRAAPAELRHRLRTQRRLRVAMLLSLAVLVLGVLPLIFVVRASADDPVFASLDALTVPAWAEAGVEDNSSGSQWCFFDCRFREREARSERGIPETTTAWSTALGAAGWRAWTVGGCPEQPISDGKYTCWRRDEFTLDLWVHEPECAADAIAQRDPAVVPPQGSVEEPKKCTGSTVSIKVQTAVADPRGKPGYQQDPGLTGETPEPTLDLPTPLPS